LINTCYLLKKAEVTEVTEVTRWCKILEGRLRGREGLFSGLWTSEILHFEFGKSYLNLSIRALFWEGLRVWGSGGFFVVGYV